MQEEITERWVWNIAARHQWGNAIRFGPSKTHSMFVSFVIPKTGVLPLPTNQVSAIPEQLEIGEMMFGESQPESLLNWIRVRVQHRARDLRDREAMIGSRCVGAVQGGLPNHTGVPCGSMGLGELMTWGCWKCHWFTLGHGVEQHKPPKGNDISNTRTYVGKLQHPHHGGRIRTLGTGRGI